MTSQDVEMLVEEIRRYLAAVDTFRAQGREVRWRSDPHAPGGGADQADPTPREDG